MAGPIAHIYLALQILAGPLQGHYNEKEFLLGTSFPDIRYLKLIERAETHFDHVTLNDIKKEKNSFKAGMLFHSFVDEKREAYIEKNHIYKRLPDFRFVTQSVKFAEDKILSTLFDVKKYLTYFNEICSEERSYKIPDKNLIEWHEFLKDYFTQKLSVYDLTMRYFNLHEPDAWFIKRWFFSWYYAKRINAVCNDILENAEFKDMKNVITNFYLNFINRVQDTYFLNY